MSIALAGGRADAQYIIEHAYPSIPIRGAAAKGMVIWNHGLQGNHDATKAPPSQYVRLLAEAGWDVRHIKRDALQEGTGWTSGGQRHVARTVEEVERAKNEGYAHVILAGQSYGGSIALEAARRIDVYAVVVSAPGTGITANEVGSPMSSAQGSKHLYESLADGRFERAVVLLPFADEYASSSPERGRQAREILARRNLRYLPLDDISTQLVGHGAGSSPLMIHSYGPCFVAFLDPAAGRPAGPNDCGRDGLPVANDVLPETSSLKAAALPRHEWWGQYQGIWVGAWGNPALVSIALEQVADGYELVYLTGPPGSKAPARSFRAKARLEGSSVAATLPHMTVSLGFSQTSRLVTLTWRDKGRSGWIVLRRYEAGAR